MGASGPTSGRAGLPPPSRWLAPCVPAALGHQLCSLLCALETRGLLGPRISGLQSPELWGQGCIRLLPPLVPSTAAPRPHCGWQAGLRNPGPGRAPPTGRTVGHSEGSQAGTLAQPWSWTGTSPDLLRVKAVSGRLSRQGQKRTLDQTGSHTPTRGFCRVPASHHLFSDASAEPAAVQSLPGAAACVGPAWWPRGVGCGRSPTGQGCRGGTSLCHLITCPDQGAAYDTAGVQLPLGGPTMRAPLTG